MINNREPRLRITFYKIEYLNTATAFLNGHYIVDFPILNGCIKYEYRTENLQLKIVNVIFWYKNDGIPIYVH